MSVCIRLAMKRTESRGKRFSETEDWTVQIRDCPQQTNGHDCGVFACAAILSLVAQFPLPYSDSDITMFRQHISQSIASSLIEVECHDYIAHTYLSSLAWDPSFSEKHQHSHTDCPALFENSLVIMVEKPNEDGVEPVVNLYDDYIRQAVTKVSDIVSKPDETDCSPGKMSASDKTLVERLCRIVKPQPPYHRRGEEIVVRMSMSTHVGAKVVNQEGRDIKVRVL